MVRRPKSKVKRQKPSSGYRPLTGRALQSLSDALRPFLFEARVLDLYAGSGRFGAMAAREGAKQVVFVEKDPQAELLKTVARGKPFALQAQEVDSYLKALGSTFDIVFADPPFEQWEKSNDFGRKMLHRLQTHLALEGLLILKVPKRLDLGFVSEPWRIHRKVIFGESQLLYFHNPLPMLQIKSRVVK